MFIAWVSLIAGVFLIASALINRTKNLESALFYKVVPFFLGLAELLSALVLFGVLSVP